jgi:hypothetical protein
MSTDKLLEAIFYCLPALIVSGIAFYFFQLHFRNEEKKRHFVLMRANRKQSLPLRLQAYERMALLMERIDPAKMMLRIQPVSDDKADYANFVAAQIDQEFEHNLTQQIYLSDDCWNAITMAKNATIQLVRKAALSPDVTDAGKLREAILRQSIENPVPSVTALEFIKNEVKGFL